MRTKLNRLVPLLGICILWWGVGCAWSAPIVYKQTMTKIFDESQFQGWPDGHGTDGRSFTLLTNSLNGSKIGFKVVVTGYDAHTFVANSNGSGIVDLTANFPATVSPYSAAYYKLDATGTRLFFKDPNTGNSFNFYYFDLAANDCKLAVLPKPGNTYAIYNPDFRKPFSLTTIGSQVTLFFKHDDGHDGVRNNRGIYTAMLGGPFTKLMDIDQLPGAQNMNLLRFLGSAAQTNQILFTWNQDYYNPPSTAMWKVTTPPTRVPDEVHTYIWPEQDLYGNLVSADGAKALYYSANPKQLYLVDLASGAKTFINETIDINGYFAPALSPSGNYAFFSTLGHKYTRHNLATGEQRDTWALWFTESSWVGSDFRVSDITADDRSYFMASKPDGDIARIHRVDTAPTNFSQTPNISAINFSAPRLVNDGTTKITVTAAVSDIQGLGTIDRVRLQCLVDGLEKPAWLVGAPVYYDPVMYDDGSNGDQVAGDGIYTNNTIRTNTTSNFYEKYPLPHNIGIRIVARDQERNYVLADTVLTVAKTAGVPIAAPLTLLLFD